MVEVSAQIDQAALSALARLLEDIKWAAPRRLASETRHAMIEICKSIRARTKKAPKKAPRREMDAVISSDPPKYVHSNSSHHKLLRRWTLTRLVGTSDENSRNYYIYTDRHRVKGGKMRGGSAATERRELLKEHGGISRPGLAKKSWGWIMKKIYNGADAGDLSWKRTKGERRDPTKAVNGVFNKTAAGAEGVIANMLDYATDALKTPSAVSEAIAAAVKKLEHNVLKRIMEKRGAR